MAEFIIADRVHELGRGKRLEYFTIAWNTVEGIVAVVAAVMAGSISLMGFGIDSFIEVLSGSVLLWRMSVDANVEQRHRNEKRALRIIGVCFLALAVYIAYESATDLVRHRAPGPSLSGIILACASLVVMPLLSRAKHKVAAHLGSPAMHADAQQTQFCTYHRQSCSAALVMNTVFGLWWTDPVAGLIMVPIIANEGIEGIRGQVCRDCATDARGLN